MSKRHRGWYKSIPRVGAFALPPVVDWDRVLPWHFPVKKCQRCEQPYALPREIEFWQSSYCSRPCFHAAQKEATE